MALWGSSDNIVSAGIVTLTYATGVVQGEEFNSQFGQVGGAKTGDIIRFGLRDASGLGTYFGDAPIISIASSTRLTIGNTMGLVENGPSIAGTDYYISELPISSVEDFSYSNRLDTNGYDKNVYGISTSAVAPAIYADAITHHGWVGIMTYTDMHGNLRVKSETLVAAGKDVNGSGGITTGGNGIPYPSYS
tara:strand:- start:145 stop:717 length:573 start_codon:yes stop_codon:yes gene_type:complete